MGNWYDRKIIKFVFIYPFLALDALILIIYLLFSAIINFQPSAYQGVLTMNEALIRYLFPIFVVYVFICAFVVGIVKLNDWLKRRSNVTVGISTRNNTTSKETGIDNFIFPLIVIGVVILLLLKESKENDEKIATRKKKGTM